MNKLIADLEAIDLITDCEGAYGSLLLLAVKSHQEICMNIHAFIWKICVSYRPLNSITIGFELPIPRCANSI